MKLDLNLSDPRTRRLLIIGGVVLLVIIGILIMVIRSQSKFAFPTNGTSSDANDNTLFNAIQECTTKYRQALALGQTDSTPPKSTCIKNAVDTYVNSKCPFVNDSASYFASTANQGTYASAYTEYQKYMNTTASTAGSQYGVTTATNYINAVVTGITTPAVSADIVKKARKADLTGPTRRYLASSCSGIYAPASGSTDSVSSIYQGWTATQGTTLPTAGTTTTYGFYNALVTGPRILEWSIKAADMVTVTPAVSIAANASTATLAVSNPVTITNGSKITVPGIGGQCTVTAAVSAASSIPISFTAQTTAQTVTAGTAIYMNTQTTITTVTPLTGANGATVGTAQTITTSASAAVTTGGPFTGCVLAFASGSLHSSIKEGSQVLLSGLAIPGNITVSTITATSVTVLFDNLTIFPSFPVGQTLENIISIPYANPVQATPPLHVTAMATGVTGVSITVTVNGTGTGVSAATGTGTIVTLPTLTLTGSNTIRLSGTATASGVTTYTLTNYASTSATTGTQITWPDIPVGTVILANPVAPATVGALITTTATNTTYNKVGKLNGTIMPLWQIAQTTGPGTYWPNFNSVAQPQYSL